MASLHPPPLLGNEKLEMPSKLEKKNYFKKIIIVSLYLVGLFIYLFIHLLIHLFIYLFIICSTNNLPINFIRLNKIKKKLLSKTCASHSHVII